MKPATKSKRSATRIAILFGAAVIIACGGGGGLFPNTARSLFGFPWLLGNIFGTPTGSFVQVDYNGDIYGGFLPPGHTVQQNQLVAGFRAGTVFLPDADIQGADCFVSIVNLLTLEGGLLPNVKLVQSGDNVVLTGGIVLPEGRYEMDIEADLGWYAGQLRTQRLIIEFDVFSSGFTNIPIDVRGALPRPGQSLTNFSLIGQIPPNQGQGDATIEIKPVGGAAVQSMTTKALGATTWQWDFNETLSVSNEGLEYIQVRVNF
jgi:hypothetical protein